MSIVSTSKVRFRLISTRALSQSIVSISKVSLTTLFTSIMSVVSKISVYPYGKHQYIINECTGNSGWTIQGFRYAQFWDIQFLGDQGVCLNPSWVIWKTYDFRKQTGVFVSAFRVPCSIHEYGCCSMCYTIHRSIQAPCQFGPTTTSS